MPTALLNHVRDARCKYPFMRANQSGIQFTHVWSCFTHTLHSHTHTHFFPFVMISPTGCGRRERVADDDDVAPSPTFSVASREFAASGTLIPREVLRQLKQGGAALTRGQGLTFCHVPGGALEARRALLRFFGTLADDDDPLLHVQNAPNARVDSEAWTIVQAYARLRRPDFAHGAPVLPPPPPEPVYVPHARYHHGSLSLSAVLARLASPEDARYHGITSLPQGALVCRVGHVWAGGTTLVIDVHRS